MSTRMSITELHGILIACAGGDQEGMDGDIADVSFDDLGYDSLALIETAAVLKRDHDVYIPDDEINEVGTPSELLGMINARIGG
jgi:act minimal PKS acyl carrier protein